MATKKYIYKNKVNNHTIISDVEIKNDSNLILMGTYQHAKMKSDDVNVKIK